MLMRPDTPTKSRPKRPNTTFDTQLQIKAYLDTHLVRQPDGRLRYPNKQNDRTVAEMIGRDATESAVRKLRIRYHPGPLVPQQIKVRTYSRVVEVAPEPVAAGPHPTTADMDLLARVDRLEHIARVHRRDINTGATLRQEDHDRVTMLDADRRHEINTLKSAFASLMARLGETT